MVCRREREPAPESVPVPDDWTAVRDWLRAVRAEGRISPLVAIRAWVVASFLNAFIVADLSSPDSLEHDAAGAVRFTWEHGSHWFEVTITPAGLVDLDYRDHSTGAGGGMFEVEGILLTPDLERALRRAAGIDPGVGGAS